MIQLAYDSEKFPNETGNKADIQFGGSDGSS